MSNPIGKTENSAAYEIGDKVQILLDSPHWRISGWVEGTVVEIQPYSRHRSFYWVRIDGAKVGDGGVPGLISVLNPRKIRRAREPHAGEAHDTSAR